MSGSISQGEKIGSILRPFQRMAGDTANSHPGAAAGNFGGRGTFLNGTFGVGANVIAGQPLNEATEIVVSGRDLDPDFGKLLRYELDSNAENPLVAVEQFDMVAFGTFERARNIIFDGTGYNLLGGPEDVFRIVPGRPDLTALIDMGGNDSYDGVFAFGFLWVTARADTILIKVDVHANPPAVVDTLTTSTAGELRGIVADLATNRLWICTTDTGGDNLIKVNPNLSGSPTEELTFDVGPGVNAQDLAIGGGFLWVVTDAGFVVKIDPATPSQVGFLDTTSGGGAGASIIYDDTGTDKLWVVGGDQGGAEEIAKIDAGTFLLDSSFSLGGGSHCPSIARLGNRLWCPDGELTGGAPADVASGRIARVDPVAASVSDYLGAMFAVWGPAGGLRAGVVGSNVPQGMVLHDGFTPMAAQVDDLNPINENTCLTGTDSVEVLLLLPATSGTLLTGMVPPAGGLLGIDREIVIVNASGNGLLYFSRTDSSSAADAAFVFAETSEDRFILYPQEVVRARYIPLLGWALIGGNSWGQLRLTDGFAGASETLISGNRRRFSGTSGAFNLTIANTGVSKPWPGARISVEEINGGTDVVTITNGGSGVLIGNPYSGTPGTPEASFTTAVAFAKIDFEFDGTVWQVISAFP